VGASSPGSDLFAYMFWKGRMGNVWRPDMMLPPEHAATGIRGRRAGDRVVDGLRLRGRRRAPAGELRRAGLPERLVSAAARARHGGHRTSGLAGDDHPSRELIRCRVAEYGGRCEREGRVNLGAS
jgi:hypothetical protein